MTCREPRLKPRYTYGVSRPRWVLRKPFHFSLQRILVFGLPWNVFRFQVNRGHIYGWREWSDCDGGSQHSFRVDIDFTKDSA